MGCPCIDPKTGKVIYVPAKTKEMVYRMQAPQFKVAIKREILESIIDPIRFESHGGSE